MIDHGALVRRQVERNRLDPQRTFEVGLVGDDLRKRSLDLFTSRIEVVDIARQTAADAVKDHVPSEPAQSDAD
jgi:hypothetical protein